MTTQEFSNTFDTLLASYNTKAMFGDQSSAAEIVLDEYEKSVLLTQAQDIIVKQYFEASNIGAGFDGTERRQMDFSTLTTVGTGELQSGEAANAAKYEEQSLMFKTPANMLIILNEKIVIKKETDKERPNTYVVVPINYREYDREISKPWAQPYKKQAWRLVSDDTQKQEGKNTLLAEIVLTDEAMAKVNADGYKTPEYRLRYVRRPSPIILTNLQSSNLNIDGVDTVSECELNPVLHMDILNKAIELAYATRGGHAAAGQQRQER